MRICAENSVMRYARNMAPHVRGKIGCTGQGNMGRHEFSCFNGLSIAFRHVFCPLQESVRLFYQ